MLPMAEDISCNTDLTLSAKRFTGKIMGKA